MAEGGCPPPAPADPGVRVRVRASGSSDQLHRYGGAHPRAAVSDDSPLAAGLALRRRLVRCPDRLSARQSVIRSAAFLRRAPQEGFPAFRALSAESHFSPPVPPRFVILRLAVPPSALFASARSGRGSVHQGGDHGTRRDASRARLLPARAGARLGQPLRGRRRAPGPTTPSPNPRRLPRASIPRRAAASTAPAAG